jgi:transposase
MNAVDLKGPPPQPKTLEEAQQRIAALWGALGEALERIEQLEEQLSSDSGNSSKAPSSDGPKSRAQRRRKPSSGRAPGAQPGHQKHERALVPEEEVDAIERFFPSGCEGCGGTLGLQAEPVLRHQVFDLPPVSYQVTEYQLYGGECPACHRRTVAKWPAWVPNGQMGPGLLSWIVLLSGQFHLSVRQIQGFLQEQWRLSFSVGAISQAQGKVLGWLGPLYRQIGAYVRQVEIAHADETTHYRGTERRWLWVLATPLAVYLMTHYSRGKAAAMALLGGFAGVLVTDHYVGYNDYARSRRQLCWAHLIRRLEAIAQRRGQAGQIGRRLLLLARAVIRTHHRGQAGTLPPDRYYRRMQRLRAAIRARLEQGQALEDSKRTANQCRHLLKDEALYWTFLSDPRIPLTNNCAEQALRPYVLWRKISFASQSYRGDQFRPLVLSIIETAQRLKLRTSELLREVCTAGLRGEPITTRLPLPDPRTPKLPP